MYSGSDSNESQKYANWPLNQASFQSVPGEHVDWAALAQQWIIMKEAGPPPIPGEQPVIINKKRLTSQEGGEAEMDVENEKEAPPPPVWSANEPPPPPGSEAWNWSQQNPNWNNWNSWAPPSAVPPPAPNIGAIKAPLLPTPSNNSYTEPPESTSDNAVPFGSYNSNSNNEYHSTSSSYWNNSSVPSKHIKPHNKRYSKVNVPIRASGPLHPMPVPVEPIPSPTPPPALDTAKRKQLPAWIREGLEKMEKEKLKQMEKQKEKEERDTYMEQNKQSNQDTMEILKTTMKERQRSRFESDEENSNEDKRKAKKPKIEEATPLTHEELMLKVRRTMTEILLNVTNRHIEAVCKEELQRYTKNRKASDAASAPSGANIRSRLGLAIYGGDDSGSSSEDDRDDEHHRDSKDSDDELKDSIKRKMTDFQKTEREIEDKLEEAERRKGGSVSRSSSPESNDNDSQVDARAQGRKYFQHDTRQSSPPKSKQQRSSSSSSQESEYSKPSRRSSSSESKDSYKKSSKKRSITPEKRHRTISSRWSKSPSRRSDSRRDSNGSKRDRKKRRSRSSSYSRSRRSRSSSYRKSRRSRSRERSKRSRSTSRSRYSRRSPSSSRSDRKRRRRSRSDSSGRGKRSHRH